jgi:hypothetical protein
VQELPAEMPQPAKVAGPSAPPLAPPTPSWKQELKQDVGSEPAAKQPVAEPPAAEQPAAEQPGETPKES